MRITPSKCPHCGHTNDAAISSDGDRSRMPLVGDIAICLYCEGVNEYGEGLTLIKAKPATLNEYSAEIASALEPIREYRNTKTH